MPFPSHYGQQSYGSTPSTNSPYVLAAETSLSRSTRPGNEVTATSFDSSHELFWTANATGRISGYMAASGMKQVSSFNVVRNVITAFEVYDEIIVATTCDAVFGFKRNGNLLFKATSPAYHDLRTICRPSPRRNQIVLGGRQKDLVIFDIETQKIVNSQSDSEGAPVSMIKANHSNIVTCNERGLVQIRSMNGEKIQEVQAHLGPITGFDCRENLFVTAGSTIKTGYYNNPYGTSRADPFLKLYDIRFVENPQMQPISTPSLPQYVFFTGNHSPGGILMTSHFGDMWALNLNSPHQSRSIATHSTYSAISLAAISSTHQVFGTIDVNQNAFLYATYSENLRSYGSVNYYSSPYPQYEDYGVEYWDPNQAMMVQNGEYYGSNGNLNDMTYNFGQMSMNSMVRNVPFPSQLYSDIVNLIKSASKGLIPIYPTDFFLEYENRSNFLTLPSEKQSEVVIPKLYKQPKMMNRHEPQIYENYNTSSHVPLLPSKSAPVVNCFLRAVSGVPLLKNIVLNHLCRRPSCILCEVHLTFRSIWTQENENSVVPVTCSSVIREMSAYSDFAAIKKVTPAGFSGLGPSMFSNFFFTHAFSNAKSGYDESTSEELHFEPLMSISQERRTQCSACGTTESEKILKRVITLDYNSYDGTRSIPFTELLEKSFGFEEKTKQFAQCTKCNRRAIKKESRSDVELPPVLVIDTDMNKTGFEFWSRNADDFCQRPEGSMHEFDERFAGENEYLTSQRFNGHGSSRVHYGSWRYYIPAMFCVVPDTKAGHIQISSAIKPDGKTYVLCGALFSVRDSDGERFIAACKNLKPKISALNWTIFNDYIVTAVKEQEALYTHTSWKLPHLLFFCELDSMNKPVTAVTIPKSVFDLPSSGTIQNKVERAPLPEPGDKVALDSEFIMNNFEEHDIGRISCLNAKQEIIFDDYALLSTGEGITNYLTQYSGIVATDLAPNVSKKFLLPRKFIYMKVLYLIQNKNIFIGHALKNDFKVMNIYLPKNQVLDTAELFRLDPKQQLFSLRDLVKSIFGIDIHTIAHDSVEDAMYALKLYEVIVQNCGIDCIRNPWLTAVNEATQKIYLDRTNSTNGSGHSQ